MLRIDAQWDSLLSSVVERDAQLSAGGNGGEEAVCRGLPQSVGFFGDSDGSDWVLPTWNVVTFPEEKESVRRAEGDFVWVTLEVTVLLEATGSQHGEEEGV